MTSCGDNCTLILETYCTAFASMLPTREVNDGRPRFPGGGCVMSAPGRQKSMSMDGAESRMGPTHDHRWICGVVEESDITGFWDGVDPPELYIDSYSSMEIRALMKRGFSVVPYFSVIFA